ncbi:MAG: hypothetical protein ACXVIQ_13160 [Ilumatobacteraceae bacterium]
MRKQLVTTAAVILVLASCGSSGGVAATATKGDAFCKLAATAKQDNDTLNTLDFTDTAKLKLDLSAAIDSLSAAVAKAPKDIADTAQQLLTAEELVEKLLKDNNYDIDKMSASAEGKKALADISKSTVPDDFDKYLKDKCGIASSDTTPSDTTPSDTTGTTSPSDTTPADTTVTGGSTVDTIVDLGEGAAAINKFLDYYELGTGNKLTADERSCIVTKLTGKVTGAELNQAIAGNSSTELEQALGLAFIDCHVTVTSTP